MKELRKMTGRDNLQSAQQWRQLGTTAATVTANFWMFTPVNGNAVLSVLTDRGATDALAYIDSATKTFYEGIQYTGSFSHVRVTSGEIIIYKQGI
jgi:hypothetical protein